MDPGASSRSYAVLGRILLRWGHRAGAGGTAGWGRAGAVMEVDDACELEPALGSKRSRSASAEDVSSVVDDADMLGDSEYEGSDGSDGSFFDDDDDGEFDFDDDDAADDDDDYAEGGAAGQPVVECFRQHELRAKIEELITQVTEVTALPVDTAVSALHVCDWNAEKAIQGVLENPAAVGRRAGFGVDEGGPAVPTAPEEQECCVCMDTPEDGAEMLRPLSCGHQGCKACWRDYLQGQVMEGSCVVTCMGSGCRLSVGHSRILACTDSEVQLRYWKLLHEAVVTQSKQLVWCPQPECETVIQAESAADRCGSVVCRECRQPFCFDCGVEHEPATCGNMKEFERRKQAEGGDVQWLTQNTKECPKCSAFIEKAGGCNWIKCYKCKFEFCWLCGRHMLHSEVDAAGGDHKCNVFKEGEKAEIDARKKSSSKEREADQRRKFAHYFTRHQAHEESAKLESGLANKLQRQAKGVQGDSLKLLYETQSEALEQLRHARRSLCSSYIFGLYQEWDPSTSLKEVFEDLQHLLENRTEKLSHQIEKSLVRDNAVDDALLAQSRSALMADIDAVRTNRQNLIAATTTTAASYCTPCPEP